MASYRVDLMQNLSDKLAGKVIWLNNSKLIYSILEKTVKRLIIAKYDQNDNVEYLLKPENKDIDAIIGWLAYDFSNEKYLLNQENHRSLEAETFEELLEMAKNSGVSELMSERKRYRQLTSGEKYVASLSDGYYLVKLSGRTTIKKVIDEFFNDFYLTWNIRNNNKQAVYALKNGNDEITSIFEFDIRDKFIETPTGRVSKTIFLCLNSSDLHGSFVSDQHWKLFIEFIEKKTEYKFDDTQKASLFFPYVIDKDHHLHYIYELPETLYAKEICINAYVDFTDDIDKQPRAKIRLPNYMPITEKLFLKYIETENFPILFNELNELSLIYSKVEGIPDSIILSDKNTSSIITLVDVKLGDKKLHNICAHSIYLEMAPEDMPSYIKAQTLKITKNLADRATMIMAGLLILDKYEPNDEDFAIVHNIDVHDTCIYYPNFTIPYGIKTEKLNIVGDLGMSKFSFKNSQTTVTKSLFIDLDYKTIVDFSDIKMNKDAKIEYNSKTYSARGLKIKTVLRNLFSK